MDSTPLSQWLIDHEPMVRSVCFFSILIIMMLWEALSPKRPRKYTRLLRWSQNIALVFLNSFIIRLVLPLATISVALYAQQHNFGLFNKFEFHPVFAFILTIILFDMAIYWQHRIFHMVPWLWSLHKVHHVDQDIDVTTGSRFHTIEILISLLIKFSLVLVLGPPVVAIMVFEIILNATAMFNHANVALPSKLDRLLRVLLVTPDMHRVHHSTILDESNRNFGFNLSCWDRIFNSYQAQPSKGHLGMDIGVKDYTDPRTTQYLPAMLWLPFAKKPSSLRAQDVTKGN
ncbi:sterol desaturase family protein [Bermanella sp. WJH001]|uniref:sterol desaturase family protein n=1 Tax=Bermanella sp. WJH001 TaxID=3048005 RepID=UPI0024BE62EE|nr:sterol desaturase family protein [Bermanella sp. WJH001]MDJ1539205.1 sterol desaturase family protein [Bermanella sp. WJH001]